MNEEFVREHDMVFVEKGSDGPFWGGTDRQRGHFYELFLTGGPEGPNPDQIRLYQSFVENFDSTLTQIADAFTRKIRESNKASLQRYLNKPVSISIIGLLQTGVDHDIEVICDISRKVFIFTRRLSGSFLFKDNRLLSAEIFG